METVGRRFAKMAPRLTKVAAKQMAGNDSRKYAFFLTMRLNWVAGAGWPRAA